MKINKSRVKSLTEKLYNKFKGNTPTEIFRSLQLNEVANEMINNTTINDIVMSCLLIPIYHDIDLNGGMEILSHKLFGFSYFEINSTDNYDNCNKCGGDGEVTCTSCGGDGEVSSDDEDGYDTQCPDCHGQGYESCEWCDGSGESESESIDYDVFYIISYNENLLLRVNSLKEGEEIEINDLLRKINDQYIIVKNENILGNLDFGVEIENYGTYFGDFSDEFSLSVIHNKKVNLVLN
jgi:hypothetical protein